MQAVERVRRRHPAGFDVDAQSTWSCRCRLQVGIVSLALSIVRRFLGHDIGALVQDAPVAANLAKLAAVTDVIDTALVNQLDQVKQLMGVLFGPPSHSHACTGKSDEAKLSSLKKRVKLPDKVECFMSLLFR